MAITEHITALIPAAGPLVEIVLTLDGSEMRLPVLGYALTVENGAKQWVRALVLAPGIGPVLFKQDETPTRYEMKGA